jgi:hypothetical protein
VKIENRSKDSTRAFRRLAEGTPRMTPHGYTVTTSARIELELAGDSREYRVALNEVEVRQLLEVLIQYLRKAKTEGVTA